MKQIYCIKFAVSKLPKCSKLKDQTISWDLSHFLSSENIKYFVNLVKKRQKPLIKLNERGGMYLWIARHWDSSRFDRRFQDPSHAFMTIDFSEHRI